MSFNLIEWGLFLLSEEGPLFFSPFLSDGKNWFSVCTFWFSLKNRLFYNSKRAAVSWPVKWRKGKTLCLHLTNFVNSKNPPSCAWSKMRLPLLQIWCTQILISRALANYPSRIWLRSLIRQKTDRLTDRLLFCLMPSLKSLYLPSPRQERKSDLRFTPMFSTEWTTPSIRKMTRRSRGGICWL